jgi:dTMP kinase
LEVVRVTIEKELLAGTTILCDRYAFSGVAFSAAKASLSYEWCQAPDILLPAPDLVLFLDVTPEVARKRGGYGEERYEKEEMQLKVRKIFKQIEVDTLQADDGLIWSTIDASRGLDEVEESIRTIVHPLKTGVEGEVRKLWSHLLADNE